MTLFELLQTLHNKNIQVSISGDNLKIDAPKGTLTPELASELKQNKQSLLTYLAESQLKKEAIVPIERNQEMVLSFAQQRLWFIDQIDGGSAHYNTPGVIDVTGDFNIEIAENAFQNIIKRHEPLRTNFKGSEQGTRQIINDHFEFKISQIDLSKFNENEQTELIDIAIKKDVELAFNLSEDLLLRVSYFRLNQNQGVMLFNMHHIASDGWSISILVNEFLSFYRSELAGVRNTMPPLDIQYADYAYWQRHWLKGEILERQLEYWSQQLDGLPQVHSLPLDFERPKFQTFDGKQHTFSLDITTLKQLNKIAVEQQATLFMVLHAAFSLMLSRYANGTDIVIATPVANRLLQELEPLIGFFVNTLVLRTDCSQEQTFIEYLKDIKRVNLEAQSNQDVPFEYLVDRINPKRSTRYNALFQIMLSMESNDSFNLELPEISLSPRKNDHIKTKFELELNVIPVFDEGIGDFTTGLHFNFDYNTSLFKQQTIIQLAESLQTLLTNIAANPNQLLSELSILNPHQTHYLLHELNVSEDLPETNLCLHQLFEQQVNQSAIHPALVFKNETLSYQQLNEKSNKLAHFLIAQGVKPDDLIGICLERSVEMIVAIIAVLKSGAGYLPLDPEYPIGRLKYMIKDAGISQLLTQKNLNDISSSFEVVGWSLDDNDLLDQLNSYSSENPVVTGLNSSNLAYVIYTSGSTGQPKGVLIEHHNIANHVIRVVEQREFNEDFRFLQFSSMSFDTFTEQTFAALTSGATTYLRDKTLWTATEFYQYCNINRITATNLVPVYLSELLSDGNAANFWLSTSLRTVVVGGDKLTHSIIETWIKLSEKSKCELFNAYGPTEATITSHYKHISKENSTRTDWDSIGHVLPGRKAYILDPNTNLTPMRSMGELYLGGHGLARGYLNQPQLNKEKFINHTFSDGTTDRLYRTGDQVCYLPDKMGEMEFIGRVDDQIKLRGFRIELGEIEYCISQHKDISTCVVMLREDSPGYKQIIAYYVSESKECDGELSLRLKAKLAEDLPDYMIPSVYVRINDVPLNPNGKVDRNRLPKPPSVKDQTESHQSPKNDIEFKLCQIWADLLHIPTEKLSTSSNFFSLGGDSILSIQVASRALASGIQLTIKQIFEFQTIETLAPHVKSVQSSTNQKSVIGEMPLLPIHHNFLLNKVDQHHFNQSIVLKTPSDFTPQLMKKFIQLLLIRHDALRLRFFFDSHLKHGEFQDYNDELLTKASGVISLNKTGFKSLEAHANKIQSAFSLSSGPLFKAIHCTDIEGDIRLLLIAHHAVIDGVSWRIIFEDLEHLYSQYCNENTLELSAKTTSYQAWAKFLLKYSKRKSLVNELSYWQTVVNSPPNKFILNRESSVHLDKEFSNDSINQSVNFNQKTFNLNRQQTTQLLTVAPNAYKTHINELLLSALFIGFYQWTGDKIIHLDLEGHGREELSDEVNLNQTVGWFTTIFPLVLSSDNVDIKSVVCAVKEKCRRVPNNGIGFGVLKYLAEEQTLASYDHSSILFNYLGQFNNKPGESYFSFSDESSGDNISPLRKPQHDLNFNGSVIEGQLSFVLDYKPSLFASTEMEQLLTDIKKSLIEVVKHCLNPINGCSTPADFPLSSISFNQLKLWLKTYQIEDIYPATAMQKGMIFHTAQDPSAYLSQLAFTLEVGVKLSVFRQSWQTLLNRHSVLRTVFVTDDNGDLQQLVVEDMELPWSEKKLNTFSEIEQMHQIKVDSEQDKDSGFNLEQGPLMRIKIWHLAHQRYRVLLTNHHALTDGWSMPLIFAEVMQIYQSILNDTALEFTPAIPYRNYIQWLNKQDNELAVRYWSESLSGLTQATRLADSMSFNDGQIKSIRYELSVDKDISDQLVQMAQKSQVTINSVLQGVWACLLFRYCDQSTVVFATTVSGRPEHLSDVEKMIGLFINTIPVKVDMPVGQKFDEWVKTLHKNQIARSQYSYLPLVDIQQLAELGSAELTDNLFVFENFPINENSLNRVEGSTLQASDFSVLEETNYKLTVTATLADILKVSFNAKSSDYSQQSLSRLVKHFENLLSDIAQNPQQLVNKTNLLSVKETHHLIHELNNTHEEYDDYSCIHNMFENQVRETPDSTAIVCQEKSITYADLNNKANQLAYLLIEQGVKPDDLVGLCIERSIEMMVALLAILKAGGAYLPLDPTYPQVRLNHMIHDSGLSLILTQTDLTHVVADKVSSQVVIDDPIHSTKLHQFPTTNPQVEALNSNHLAYVIYTSGSTGKPKGVMLEHHGLVNLASTHIKHFSVDSDCNVLQFASINFDAATWEWVMALSTGASLYICPDSVRYNPQALSDFLKINHITHALLPPAVLQHLDAEQNYAFKALVVGGEAYDQSLSDLWGSKYAFYNAYGPSESTVCATTSGAIENKKLTMGKAISNTRLYLLDQHQNLVPHSTVGELYIAGAGLARGYLNQPQLTAERFIQHTFSDGTTERLYRTGDLVKYTGNNDLLFIGRTDHQIKIRGFRVELPEIEQTLLTHDAVHSALVMLENSNPNHPGREKRLVAYVTTGQDTNAQISDELKTVMKSQLPRYMIPAVIIQLKKFPLTANGKVNRKALPDPASVNPDEALVKPRSKTEKRLSKIWERLLNLPIGQVSSGANFFELGGHSLLVTTLLHRIDEALGVKLKIKDIYQSPTISDLANKIDSLDSRIIYLLEKQDHTKPLPLSYGQYRIWFTEQIKHQSNEHNMAVGATIKGDFKCDILERALNLMIKQHDVLRTEIKFIDNQPMQVISASYSHKIEQIDLTHLSPNQKAKEIKNRTKQQDTQVFDLSELPLFSVLCLKVEVDEFIVHFNQHHIISDGWSQQLFYSQLMSNYHLIEQQQIEVTEQHFNYADYAVWQRQWLVSDEAEQQKTFWKTYLSDCKEHLTLPYQKSKGSLESKQNMLKTRLGLPTITQLKAMAHRNKGSLFNVLQSAFAVMIARLSGENDFNIGVPVTGRHVFGTENMLGMFLNTLPLRHQINLSSSYQEVLTEQILNVKSILSNQDLPLEQIIEISECERETENTPLFQILFNMLSLPESTISDQDFNFSMEMNKTAEIENKFNLTLYINESTQGIEIYCNYNSSKFSQHGINVMLDQYTGLLKQIACDDEKPCYDYHLNQGLAKIDYDVPLSNTPSLTKDVTSRFRDWVERQPEAIAIKDEYQNWTYQELLTYSYGLAIELQSIGVQKEQVVTLMAARQANMVASILAALQIGATYSILTPETPVNRIIQHIKTVKSSVLLMCEGKDVYDCSMLKSLNKITQLLYLNNNPHNYSTESLCFEPHENSLEAVACITFTSGSAGIPKAVEGTHLGLSGYLDWLPKKIGIHSNDQVGMLSGLAHDPLQRDIFEALCCGATLNIPSKEQFKSYQLSTWIKEQKISILHLTPAMVEVVCLDAEVDLRSLKVLFITGETLQKDTVNRLRALNEKMQILNCYGATESQRALTYYDIDIDTFNDFNGAVPISMLSEDTRLRLINEHGIDCGFGEAGYICIESSRIAKGYLNNKRLTAEVFSDFDDEIRRYNTGDLGVCLDSNHVNYLGRKDTQVNIRGFRVELGEVAYQIRQYNDVKSCAVIIRNSEQIIAYVTTHKTFNEESFIDDLTAYLANHLLEYMRPSAIVVLADLPLTANNKIDYQSLPDCHDFIIDKKFKPPIGSTEVKLATLWSELLQLDIQHISSEAGFFELGGHSLLLLKLQAKIRSELQLEINLKFLFECKSLSSLAELIDSLLKQTQVAKTLSQAAIDEIDEVEF